MCPNLQYTTVTIHKRVYKYKFDTTAIVRQNSKFDNIPIKKQQYLCSYLTFPIPVLNRQTIYECICVKN